MEAPTVAPTGCKADPAARIDSVRLTTETKQAFKTSEFWAYVALSVAILVSAASSSRAGDTDPGTDEFIASQAWLYVAVVDPALHRRSRDRQVRLARSVHREPRQFDNGHRH